MVKGKSGSAPEVVWSEFGLICLFVKGIVYLGTGYYNAKITQPVPFGLLGIFPVIIDFHAAVASEIADAISDNDNFLDVGWIGHVKFSTKVENYLVSVMEETVKIKWKKSQLMKN